MRSKEVISNNLDKLRNNINNIKYIVNTGGSFHDLLNAFEVVYTTLDNIDNLISIEPDEFGNKII